jgi:hypothetical protein
MYFLELCEQIYGGFMKLVLAWFFWFLVISMFAQFAGGTGTSDDPYQVATPQHLDNIRNYLSSYFLQTADINLGIPPYNTGYGWNPIGGTNPYDFTGSYNGGGHCIWGLYINTPWIFGTGFFKSMTGNTVGEIKNVKLMNAHVEGYSNVALLAGTLNGYRVSNCIVEGTVIAHGQLSGGFAGSMSGDVITKCYAIVNVTGDSSTGVFAGSSYGGPIDAYQATNCYAMGSVIGTSYVGGFIGSAEGTFTNCYSTAQVTASGSNVGGFTGNAETGHFLVTRCYWDTDTSGYLTSWAGTGRSTSEMTYPYSSNTYITWDFNTIWAPDSFSSVNGGYPYLRNTTGILPSLTISPEPNSITGNIFYISITSSFPGTEIRFTFDGTEPTIQAALYLQPFLIDLGNGSFTIKARSFKTGWFPSMTQTSIYNPVTNQDAVAGLNPSLLQVFPNPFVQQFTLLWNGKTNQPVKVVIYNMRGEVVFSTCVSKQSVITLNDLKFPNGVYIIQATQGNQVQTKKIVKEK